MLRPIDRAGYHLSLPDDQNRPPEQNDSLANDIIDFCSDSPLTGSLKLILDGIGNHNGLADRADLKLFCAPLGLNPKEMTYSLLEQTIINHYFNQYDADHFVGRTYPQAWSVLAPYVKTPTQETSEPKKYRASLRWLAAQLTAGPDIFVLPQWIPVPNQSGSLLIFTFENKDRNLSAEANPPTHTKYILPGDGAMPSLYVTLALHEVHKNKQERIVVLDYFAGEASDLFAPDTPPLTGLEYEHLFADSLHSVIQSTLGRQEHFSFITHSAGYYQNLFWLKFYGKTVDAEGLPYCDRLDAVDEMAGAWMTTTLQRLMTRVSGKKNASYNSLNAGLIKILTSGDLETALKLKNDLLGTLTIGQHSLFENDFDREQGPYFDDLIMDNETITGLIPSQVRYQYTVATNDRFIDWDKALVRATLDWGRREQQPVFTVLVDPKHSPKHCQKQLINEFCKNDASAEFADASRPDQIIINRGRIDERKITVRWIEAPTNPGGHFFMLHEEILNLITASAYIQGQDR
ncbi:MAG: hypothetical protein ACD_62C00658G0008 [uncultured bacterium]|nr:MAG: hypothetical protein ACD_62C00658G0008 [uncultured bacterium]